MGDYDFEPRKASGIFLKLAAQGDKVTVRIASSPYREPKVWKEGERKPLDTEKAVVLTETQWMELFRNPEFNVTEVFHWVVIDREDGKAKIYSASPMVYKAIKRYAEIPSWGDPKTYDFEVERTEKPGSYYEVTALPNKDPLTDKEQALVAELIMQLDEKLPAARKLTDVQIDYLPSLDAGDTSNGVDKPQVDDVVITDISDEPINLDDIPF